MPLPKKTTDENKEQFIARCMSSEKVKKEFPDDEQRLAVCLNHAKGSSAIGAADVAYHFSTYGTTEVVNPADLYVPNEDEYVDFNEETETFYTSEASYKYENPKTGEIFVYSRMGNYKKDGVNLIYKGKAAEYQGKKVTLNKPFRTPDSSKKFAVYTKNDVGRVVIVRFGDPDMEIKKDNPARRKSFRARHKCDTEPGPKWKARYWSCKKW